jgi:Zn finger protein HypA/HybF involved in hydrogenase expression
MYLQVVECLKCHKHYGEKNKFIPVCPFCGNDDTEKTIYLEKESNIYKSFMQGEEVANAND